jgi:hypothetical protein
MMGSPSRTHTGIASEAVEGELPAISNIRKVLRSEAPGVVGKVTRAEGPAGPICFFLHPTWSGEE